MVAAMIPRGAIQLIKKISLHSRFECNVLNMVAIGRIMNCKAKNSKNPGHSAFVRLGKSMSAANIMNRPEISIMLMVSLKPMMSSMGTSFILPKHIPISVTASKPDPSSTKLAKA